MSIAPFIRIIGRGARGARALDAPQAEDLMTQVLSAQVSDLELGAFVLAMRIKGETVDELRGFMAAVRGHCLAPRAPAPSLWLPSYNGARKLPNLTPLLALLLARQGLPVLVHGPLQDAGRVTSADIFAALGLPIAHSAVQVQQAWQGGQPAFMPTADLCPPLARLLAVRQVVGLRNSGHTMAKLLAPPRGAVLRVVNHTHAEYAQVLADYLGATSADALLLRGTEGEPVADARRLPAMQLFCAGLRDERLSITPLKTALAPWPDMPASCAAPATAEYIQAMLDGRCARPEPITQQVSCLVQAHHAMLARS